MRSWWSWALLNDLARDRALYAWLDRRAAAWRSVRDGGSGVDEVFFFCLWGRRSCGRWGVWPVGPWTWAAAVEVCCALWG